MDDDQRTIGLNEGGMQKVEVALNCGSLFEPENVEILTAVNLSLLAHNLLHKDKDYIVRDEKVQLVDEFTGRVAENRRWPHGIQTAVEVKEGLVPRKEGEILGKIAVQHFVKLYPELCGMTATAAPSAEEFKEFYDLSTVIIPPNRPCIRIDEADRVFTHLEAKNQVLVKEIENVHRTGRPILVGTSSVYESEKLAGKLEEKGISCKVLNARNDEVEATIIAEAGILSAITISTNMAGRGTDNRFGRRRKI